MFDVDKDPDEKVNLIDNPSYKIVKGQLEKMIEEFFHTHSKPEADLWCGGKSLQNSTRRMFWKDAWGDEWEPVYNYDKDL